LDVERRRAVDSSLVGQSTSAGIRPKEEDPTLPITTIQTRPVSDLREATEDLLDQVGRSDQPVVLDRDGRPSAVLMSVETYERSQRERAMLLQLARAERAIAADEGYDLEEVLAELDEELRKLGE